MPSRRRRAAWLLGVLLAAGGCRTAPPLPAGPGTTGILDGRLFETDTALEGAWLVSGECLVPRGVTLSLAPGSRILFVPRDGDGDGQGDARLRVEGRLLAVGLPGKPVVFTSAGRPDGARAPGDWDSLLFNFSHGNELRHVIIEYSAYSLHAHFSSGRVARSLIRRNLEGCRMGNCEFTIEENTVRENVSKGLNFRLCTNTVRGNEITANGNGIFLFEQDAGSTISGNNIHGNERYDLRLDDFFRGTVRLEGNWWGSSEEATIRAKVYDSRQDPEIGTAVVVPAAAPHPLPQTPPGDGPGVGETGR